MISATCRKKNKCNRRQNQPKMLSASFLYVMCFFPFHLHNDAIRRLEYQVANVAPTKLLTPEKGRENWISNNISTIRDCEVKEITELGGKSKTKISINRV
jgi:hypothetical protein